MPIGGCRRTLLPGLPVRCEKHRGGLEVVGTGGCNYTLMGTGEGDPKR
jgi:hypothetical protein